MALRGNTRPLGQGTSWAAWAAALWLAGASPPAVAAGSDTSISWRTGSHFAEPFNPNAIRRDVLNFSHSGGYVYGTQAFSIDLFLSNDKDPSGPGARDGAQEAYVLYRNSVDLQKVTGSAFRFGPVRGLAITGGFDINTKNDARYNSKKRMVVLGPTLMMDVPGFLNISLLWVWESNAPYNPLTQVSVSRYHYDAHPMFNAVWAIPFSVGNVPLLFAGYTNLITTKGKNEFGDGTVPETNVDMQLMYDTSELLGLQPKTFKLGLEYQYWRNKFGNDHNGAAGAGAFARTPMLRAEYHF